MELFLSTLTKASIKFRYAFGGRTIFILPLTFSITVDAAISTIFLYKLALTPFFLTANYTGAGAIAGRYDHGAGGHMIYHPYIVAAIYLSG